MVKVRHLVCCVVHPNTHADMTERELGEKKKKRRKEQPDETAAVVEEKHKKNSKKSMTDPLDADGGQREAVASELDATKEKKRKKSKKRAVDGAYSIMIYWHGVRR